MKGAIEITRLSAQDDFNEIAAIQARSFSNPWSAESLRWELANTDVAQLYVLRLGGVAAAYCACWVILDELHINSLAVDLECRRQGLASALLHAVFSHAVASGATQATLEVRRSNTAALKLYEQLGFKVEGVRAGYYQQPAEDALVLWRRKLAEA